MLTIKSKYICQTSVIGWLCIMDAKNYRSSQICKIVEEEKAHSEYLNLMGTN